MFGIGWGEILIIVLIVLLLFGASRIPEVMKSLGKGVREFKKGMKDIGTEAEEDEKSEPKEKEKKEKDA
jgi:sec-independent protein translocase protein TatA